MDWTAEAMAALAELEQDGVLAALGKRIKAVRPTKRQYHAALLRVRMREPFLVRDLLASWQLPEAAADDRRIAALVFMVAALADLAGEARADWFALARPTLERWARAHDPLWSRWSGELAC
ncbi:MAG: hypothetical protein NZ761_03790 [Dehalococcoidia bacterium]|nr:hypothetical protein [Dehalococcoidia bacterium]